MNFDPPPPQGEFNFNPYASPASAKTPGSPVRKPTTNDGPYVSARARAMAACTLIVLVCVACAFLVLAYTNQLSLLQRVKDQERVTRKEAEANDNRIDMLDNSRSVLFVIAGVVYLVWIHRANRNLSSLGVARRQFTPGWSVGWWFVPFAHLVQPFRVVREIWAGSDPHNGADDLTRRTPSTAPILGFWWATWIVAELASNVGRRWGADNNINSSMSATKIQIFETVLFIVSGILATIIVWQITRNQEARFDAICGGAGSNPFASFGRPAAPPVTFDFGEPN